MDNDIVYLDILALRPEIREKLHLTDNEIKFTQDDISLINNSNYVDIDELTKLIDKANFVNYEITEEIGISKAMYSMAFSNNSKNKRGLRMRTIIAILNAIRNRNIMDPFDKILIKKEK